MREALTLKVIRARVPRGPTDGPRVMVALIKCWAVLRSPAGKRLAPMLATLVPVLRRDGEFDLSDAGAALLLAMSAATIDWRLAGERAKLMPRGRSQTEPGSLLKSQIPVRTGAQWDDGVLGFVEIDLVGQEGGNSAKREAMSDAEQAARVGADAPTRARCVTAPSALIRAGRFSPRRPTFTR